MSRYWGQLWVLKMSDLFCSCELIHCWKCQIEHGYRNLPYTGVELKHPCSEGCTLLWHFSLVQWLYIHSYVFDPARTLIRCVKVQFEVWARNSVSHAFVLKDLNQLKIPWIHRHTCQSGRRWFMNPNNHCADRNSWCLLINPVSDNTSLDKQHVNYKFLLHSYIEHQENWWQWCYYIK